MKTRHYLLASILIGLVTSCSDDFLERAPLDEMIYHLNIV